jgi:hypothetical protein
MISIRWCCIDRLSSQDSAGRLDGFFLRIERWHKLLVGMTMYSLIVGTGLVLAVLWFHGRRRSTAIRAMAVRLGFAYLGGAIPGSLTLHGTPMDRATSVWNVIDGEYGGVRVVAFDCRIGEGKGSWRRTIIAALSPQNPFRGHGSDQTVDRSGAWAILYQPKTFSLTGRCRLPKLRRPSIP